MTDVEHLLRAEVLDEHGTVVLSEGDKLAVGGGYGPTPSHPCKIPYRQSFWMDGPPWGVPVSSAPPEQPGR